MKLASEATLNIRLKKARKIRGWTQEVAANRIGVAPITYSRWERGIIIPTSYNQKNLSNVYEMTPEELGFFKQAKVEKASRTQKPPTKPNINREKALKKTKYTTIQGIPVIGRDEAIEKVFSKFQKGKPHLVSLYGMAGAGKSELARQILLQRRAEVLSEVVEWKV